jgi:hypothetical protein
VIIRLCDECEEQTHSSVEIAFLDATVYFRDPDSGEFGKGRVRERKRNGDIKRRYWEIDLCYKHWPGEDVYPPIIPGNPKNIKIAWNPDKLESPAQANP